MFDETRERLRYIRRRMENRESTPGVSFSERDHEDIRWLAAEVERLIGALASGQRVIRDTGEAREMSRDRAQVRCQTPQCQGVLGAIVAGEFFPAAHIRPGRDLWVRCDGGVTLRCSFCGREHGIKIDTGHVRVFEMQAGDCTN